MSAHGLSTDDVRFRTEFETCVFPPARFDHRAHVRLAYVFLAGNNTDTAHALMRSALIAFLEHNHVPVSKYHETLTRAWILAVHHFMTRSPGTESAEAFIRANPELLDTKIMLTHYSADVLLSEEARRRFVRPDLDGIPGA